MVAPAVEVVIMTHCRRWRANQKETESAGEDWRYGPHLWCYLATTL